jgi:large repetitive protein
MHQTLRSFLPHFQRNTFSATTATSIDNDSGERRTNKPQNISDTNKPWPKATSPVYLNRPSMYSFLPFSQPRVERKISVQLGLMALLFVTMFFGGVQKAQAQYKVNVGSATVTTDKPDYAPRSNAVFSGKGFAPGETVDLRVKNLFRACNTVTADSSYLPWTVVADGSGNFITNWTVCDCNGDSLRLRAVGQSSRDTAYAYFSDGDGDGSMTVSSPSTSICANSTNNQITLNFRAAAGTNNNYPSGSQATITIPAGWTVPQKNNSNQNGFVKVTPTIGSTATLNSITSNPNGTWTILIDLVCANGTNNGFDFDYGGGGTKVTAPSTGGIYTFTTASKKYISATNTGTLTDLAANRQPVITVSPVPSAVITAAAVCASSTGNTASVPDAGTGATYAWTITNGTITSGAGTRTITYTAGASGSVTLAATVTNSSNCSASSGNTSVTINAAPSATITYSGTPYCKSLTTAQNVTRAGTAGGTYSALPAGLSIDASTGAITPSTSIAGTYTVTYTIAAANGCAQVTATTSVNITAVPVATFSYAGTSYCQSASNPSPAFSGGGVAGTFTSTAGLVINASTGQINLATSTPGTYTVTNTIAAANGCAQVTATTSVTIAELPSIFDVSYTGSLCGTATIKLSGSESGVSYSLMKGTTTVETKAGTGSDISFTSTSQNGTYTVIATNASTTCNSTMNGSVIIGGGQPPAVYTITGGGNYCAGAGGLEVGLSNSETGVTYRLYLNNSIVGTFVNGTGSAISFGNQTADGNYTVIATKTSGNCMATMSGSVDITAVAIPSAPTANNISTTYNGLIQTGFATVSTGENLNWFTTATGNVTTTAPSGTNAGTYTAWAEAQTTVAGCKSTSRTLVTVGISKADATIDVTGYTGVYDGNAHGATARPKV